MYRLQKLKNGLTILLIPQKSTQTICFLVLVKAGSKYETKKINGISHFLEHMLFKGTKKRPTQKELAEVLDKIGGAYNGFTSEEYTGFWAKTPKDHLETAIEWISDIFFNSIIPENEVSKEKKVIIEELNMYNDNPQILALRLWRRLLYGNQPAGWDIIGTKESINRINRSLLIQFQKKHYNAKNTLVCLAGNFNSNEAENLIKKYFQNIQKGSLSKKKKTKEIQKKPELLLHYKETQQTHLCLGARGFSLKSKKRYPLSLLANILGGMMSSRLFIELRDKRGLGYYIGTIYEGESDTGYLVTRTGIDNQRSEEAIEVILNEYKKIKEGLVPEEELQKAKENQKGALALTLESSDAIAFFFGVQYIEKGKIETFEEICKNIDKVTREEIRNLANEIFKPKNLNLVIVGPHKDKKKFQKLISKFA